MTNLEKWYNSPNKIQIEFDEVRGDICSNHNSEGHYDFGCYDTGAEGYEFYYKWY